MYPERQDVYTKNNGMPLNLFSNFSLSIFCHLRTLHLQIVSLFNQLVYFLQMCLL